MNNTEFLSFEKVVTGGYSSGAIHSSFTSNSIHGYDIYGLCNYIWDKIQNANTSFNPNAFTLCSLKTYHHEIGFEKSEAKFDNYSLLLTFILRNKDSLSNSKQWFKHNAVCIYGTEDSPNRLQVSLSSLDLRKFGIQYLSTEQLRSLWMYIGISTKNLSKFRSKSTPSLKLLKSTAYNHPIVNLLQHFPMRLWYINKDIVNTEVFNVDLENSLEVAVLHVEDLNDKNKEILEKFLERGLTEFSQMINNASFEDGRPLELAIFFIARCVFTETQPMQIYEDLKYYRNIFLASFESEVSSVLLSRNCASDLIDKKNNIDTKILMYFDESEDT